MTDNAKLSIGDKSLEYPVLKGTVGPEVVDIRKFYGQSGRFTYDPGFTSTASCESKITYIDGDQGVLLHRGYPIDRVALCDGAQIYLKIRAPLGHQTHLSVRRWQHLQFVQPHALPQ